MSTAKTLILNAYSVFKRLFILKLLSTLKLQSTLKMQSTCKLLWHELTFTARDRTVWLWMVVIIGLSSLSVGFGLAEVNDQNVSIQRLVEANQQERLAELAKLKDWGSAAYYSFHLTHQPPSKFAFAALGQRDGQPWKHRIRMLAIEGQVYERDVGNPSVTLIGRFDFSFLAAFIFPLVLIMLLYDIRASERTAGRYDLLEATASRSTFLWLSRAGLRSGALYFCLVAPMIVAGLLTGTSIKTLMFASVMVLASGFFWTLLCYFISGLRQPGAVILMTLIAIWLSTAVLLPASARLMIDRWVPLPSGAEILMTQRETVNDAWDLPRETTMDAFFKQHPEWADYQPKQSSFEWPWYYAFQQVGDQKTLHLSKAYRDGRLKRDQIAAWTSVFAPPSLLERMLQSIANTDVSASIDYENKVRSYHAKLRAYYYPKFYQNEPFAHSALESLPKFTPEK